ncbi:hypothetical protein C1H46_037143 [Malus baccata]|uniref:Uncharacterized protein n=1 Tax=Malus baccata TaxID=106549 RepID=A0A540KSX9_MALBA|nr:hypothetical protein C1H46_037143 [Malus baccata]
MQTRYMERSNSMAREKRSLDSSSAEEGQPDRKRPALASVIVEALKVDSLQKLCSSLEPILRRVVSEEVERALAKLGPAKLTGRSSPKQIEGPNGRNLQLHFISKLSLPLFTGGKVEGEWGSAISIVLIDANTKHVVTSGPESAVKLDIVVLEGDFNNEDDENWTQEEFESHVVKEREGKRPLLTGDVQVTLKEGVGTLGELTFTDNSSWIRSRKFRLGLKVASGNCDNIRIREAKTEAITVKDHRGELYKKHYPPVLHDEVWRLEKIGKDGSFHKRLNKAGIVTVEDFLRLVVRDSQRLRNSQNGNLNAPIQLDGLSFPQQNQLPSISHQAHFQRNENMLSLGPLQSSTSGFQNIGTSNPSSYRGVEDLFPEEEIRMRSNEILENEDMQHLLRIFNMGGQGQGHSYCHSSMNVTEDNYPYSSPYIPTPQANYSIDDDQSRSPGKAVVGWLKLKAALRWGIFVRKKAAERRAQLVELDDL